MKRLADCNSAECDLLFYRLATDQKRACLATIHGESEIEFQYMNMAQWRDIWRSCIMPFLDMQSFGRLVQCCRYFRDNFQHHPHIDRIRSFLAHPYDYEKLRYCPFKLIENVLPAYCRRLAKIAGVKVELHRFLLGKTWNPPLKYVTIASGGLIQGKTGYVLRNHLPVGSIFDEDPTYCVKPRKDRNENEKLYVKRHKANYKRIKGFL